MQMIDIDFRYVMREIKFRDPHDPAVFAKQVPILQVRKLLLDDRWKHPQPEWTEWQDVRTEHEVI